MRVTYKPWHVLHANPSYVFCCLQVFATWSVRHLLPTAVPTSSKVAELLQGATALIQQRVKSDAAAHAAAVSAEWSQLAADRSLLQASSVQESVTVLGPAGKRQLS